jgi:PAS domain-containing protein
MRPPRHEADSSSDAASDNEIQALAEAVLEAASVGGLGVTVSFDDRVAPRHVYVNDAAAKILGYGVEEFTGSAMLLNFAPEDRDRMLELAAGWRRGDVTPSTAEAVIVQQAGQRILQHSRPPAHAPHGP